MDLRNVFKNTDAARNLAAGETIFSEGDVGDVMYVVLEGDVDVQVGGTVVDVIGAGSIVGEMALIDPHERRSATAVARTACRLAALDQKRFLFMVQQTPFFSLEVMRILAARLRHMNPK